MINQTFLPKTFTNTLCAPLLLLTGTTFSFMEIKYLPSGFIVQLMGLAILLDLITGLLKSWKKGILTSSQGFKNTIIKILAYCTCIIAIWILISIVALTGINFLLPPSLVLNAVISFITFTELYSVFENIDEAYPDSQLSKFLISPVLKFLKGKITNNPFADTGDKEPS